MHDWDIEQEQLPFEDPLHLADEVRSLRRKHNSAPDSAIADVARAVRRFVVASEFDELLGSLPRGAIQFWSGQRCSWPVDNPVLVGRRL